MRKFLLLCFLAFSGCADAATPAQFEAGIAEFTQKAEAGFLGRLSVNPSLDFLVLYGVAVGNAQTTEQRRIRFNQLKKGVAADLRYSQLHVLRDFPNLPMQHIRVGEMKTLHDLLANPSVLAIYENIPLFKKLAQSLPLISQPQALTSSYYGKGVGAVVGDTGINYGHPDFGTCTAPGTPAGCRVVHAEDLAPDDGVRDDAGHGTNVGAIVSRTAPGAQLIDLDIFDGTTSSAALVVAALDWAIANQADFNIKVINFSLGDGGRYTSPCANIFTNPFLDAIGRARTVGIVTVAASGNEGYGNGLSMPACTPGAVSVGAVYDANVGSNVSWASCTDAVTAPDQVTCFSNSADYLTLLAPGSKITAGGYIASGTSQATPHVTGALAVISEAYPDDTVSERVQRLTGSGELISDNRNGLALPRLDLFHAIGAVNDSFAKPVILDQAAGTAYGTNTGASAESGEPDHGNTGSPRSIWWRWTATSDGELVLDSQGTAFDHVLVAYQGTALSGLTEVARNTVVLGGGPTSFSLSVTAAQDYYFVIDSITAADGDVKLSWALTPMADLTLSLSGPIQAVVAAAVTINATIENMGPSDADQVMAQFTLPAGVDYLGAANECSFNTGVVTCNLGNMPKQTQLLTWYQVMPAQPGLVLHEGQVSSLVSDNIQGNNSASFSMQVTLDTAFDEEIPALPLWAMTLMAASLIYLMRRAS